MTITLDEARRAPATLEKHNGTEMLIRTKLVAFVMETCKEMDAALARIPALLDEYGLKDYNTEPLQREILQDGSSSVWVAVRDQTMKRLESTGLVPKIRWRLANENADTAVPEEFRQKLNFLVEEIKGYNKHLIMANGEAVNLDSLLFRSNKLRIPPKYLEAVTPRFTFAVPDKDRKTVKAMRVAASTLADLKKCGVNLDTIASMANGKEFTDAELLGLLQGIALKH